VRYIAYINFLIYKFKQKGFKRDMTNIGEKRKEKERKKRRKERNFQAVTSS
jgi:hypothetical protein